MDGILDRLLPQMDASSVAGHITGIVAARHEQAMQTGDTDAAARYDVSLDTIYLASLLLTIVNGSGHTRSRAEVLGALDTTADIIGELRRWIEGNHP